MHKIGKKVYMPAVQPSVSVEIRPCGANALDFLHYRAHIGAAGESDIGMHLAET